MTRLIIVVPDFTSQHPKWFPVYYSDVKPEYCRSVSGCSWLFFSKWAKLIWDIPYCLHNLQALILTSWAFLFNCDHFYWFSSYCRPQTVLSFLGWWEGQVSIAAEVAKEWSIYLMRMTTYWGAQKIKFKSLSFFIS